MNAIHDLSPITTLPEFYIFAVSPNSNLTGEDKYRPISTLDSISTIEFFEESNGYEYINLRESFLFVKIQFVPSKPDKAAIDENDWKNVSVANYIFHSLFKLMDVYIEDRQITTSSTTYPYCAYIEALVLFDEEAKILTCNQVGGV